MEVLTTEIPLIIKLASLKGKPSIDVNNLQNEIISFIEEEYPEYKIEVEEMTNEST